VNAVSTADLDAPPPHRDRWTAQAAAVSLVRPRMPPRPLRFAAAPQSVEVDLARSALVVVDMQNDFCHPQGWFPAVRGVDPAPLTAPVPAINRLTSAFRRFDAPVVFVNWGVVADRADLPANVLDKASGCGACPSYGEPQPEGTGRILVAGEWGSAPVAGLDVASSDLVVHKSRLSGFKDTRLDQVLRRRDVTTVFYAGVNIDRCVFATLMDGAFEGYDPILVEDAAATASPAPVREAILLLVRQLYGFTARTADILAAAQTLLATAAPTQGEPS